ncbi:MAG: hypothetical protein ABJA98_01550 [Acidobacteriota bacterium]
MTYRLVTTVSGGVSYSGIQCLVCGRTSYNGNDIEQRYCSHCHRFHDDPVTESTR